MKRLAIAMAMGSLVACSGESGGSTPTAPTPLATSNANIEGSYNLTITASATCAASLPSATRVLNYLANISQTGNAVQGQLLAHVIWNNQAVSGIVSGKSITFSNFSFSENDTGGGVALVGTGNASVAADGSISGTLSGPYGTPTGTCTAANHQVQMVKR